MIKSLLFLLALGWAGQILGDSKPTWFTQDYRSPTEWGFFCSGTAKTEEDALKLASAQCANKICQLFGVEVEAQTQATESLKDISVNSTVIEKCPKVRVVGRVQKKKLVSCEDEACTAYVLHIYPKKEYDKEYKRLNEPKISQVLEKTIIVREGKETFRDPGKCRAELKAYGAIRGERSEDSANRILRLEAASKECRQLDYRDFNLQSELRGYLVQSMSSRSISGAMSLNRVLQENTTVETQILAFLEYEKTLHQSEGRAAEFEKLLAQNYDSLFARDNYSSEEQAWILVDGTKEKVNPYLSELKTCQKISRLMSIWPATFTKDMTACVRRVNSPGKDCRTTNILMLRAQLVGCICNVGAPAVAQDCSRVLLQALQENCPREVSSPCLKASLDHVKKMLSVAVNFRLPQ